MAREARAPAAAVRRIDTSVAHIARVQDYWLGGKDNFPADRRAGDEAISAVPDMVASVRNTRAFLRRTVGYLASEIGVRQFLDIGTGIPAAGNTHEVAQGAAPDSRVAYVDNDPTVLAYAQALLRSGPEGACAYIDADIRDPGVILDAAAAVLDFRRPVAIVLMAVLQFVPDEDDPYGIVATLVDAVAPGSYLVVSHPASDIQGPAMASMASRLAPLMAERVVLRSKDQVGRFFASLTLVAPGLVRVPEWRPLREADAAGPSTMWGGVARKDVPASAREDFRALPGFQATPSMSGSAATVTAPRSQLAASSALAQAYATTCSAAARAVSVSGAPMSMPSRAASTPGRYSRPHAPTSPAAAAAAPRNFASSSTTRRPVRGTTARTR